MRLLVVAAALLAALAPLHAQTAPDSSGFATLDAEIRATPLPGDLYYRQLAEAWDRAVVARQYGRADSVAVLAEAAIAETTGLDRDSLVWPSPGDRLALRLLSGDVAAVESLADPGTWGALDPTQVPDAFLYESARQLVIRPLLGPTLRTSTANVLTQDSSAVVERLAARGADAEAVAAARLAIGKLLLQPVWLNHGRVLSDAQIALNDRADAFLARYPGSRFGRFVREVIRLRYRVDGAVSLYLGLRYGWLHADLGFHGTDLRVTESRSIGRRSLVEGDRLTFGLLGVDVGPRVPLGGLDVLPYVSGGLLIQGTMGPSTDEPERSTYEPPNRPGWGYGLALEYLGGRSQRYGGVAVRLRVSRLVPQFSGGFEDTLDGPITTVSLGATLTGILRTRID